MYPNDNTRTCDDCSISCLTCYGPSNNECIKCNYLEKYYRSASGACEVLSCQERTYLYINFEEEKVECLDCNEYCLTCNGGNKTDCLECNRGYLSFPGNSRTGNVICKTCEEVNVGYYTDANGECDGKVLFKLNRNLWGRD